MQPPVRLGGEEHNRSARRDATDLGDGFQATQTGHLAVEDQQIRLEQLGQLDGIDAIPSLTHHLEAIVFVEEEPHQIADLVESSTITTRT